jgi:LytR cell envelope-related transcriptional attenuator/cell envelope-related transcriptional attenuator-like protein
MSIQAPERARGFDRELLPPIAGPSPRRVHRLKTRRRRARRLVALAVLLAVVATGLVLLVRSGRTGNGREFVLRPAPASMAWAVHEGSDVYVSVIAVPAGRSPVAVVVPARTAVDVPGGPLTVGAAAADDSGLLIASVAATFNRRVGHYLVSQPDDLRALVDQLGGIEVTVESPFEFGAKTIEPGVTRLSGAGVLTYLATGPRSNGTGRWEDVLAGVLTATSDPTRWSGSFGDSDDPGRVARLLKDAHGAAVIELATAPQGGGVVAVVREALPDVVQRFGAAVGPLVRVVVLNGNGRPGMGAAVASLIAPMGYRVVASQNASKFDVGQTQIVAAGDGFVAAARQVGSLLGVGKVYVGSQPTGIADVTIVVGRDFKGD